MSTSGWMFAIRKRWYAQILVRTPLGSLAIVVATAAGLWLLASEVNLTRFTTVIGQMRDGALHGTAPLQILESVGREGYVLWRPADGHGPARTAQLVDWRETKDERAEYVIRVDDSELGAIDEVSIDFPSGIETIAQRLSKRVLGRAIDR